MDADHDEAGFFDAAERKLKEKRAEAQARAEVAERAIGERLRKARGDAPRRLVVKMLEDDHGIVMLNSTLAAIENGERGIRLSEAVALASIYRVELRIFTDDEDADRTGTRLVIRELHDLRDSIDHRIDELGETL